MMPSAPPSPCQAGGANPFANAKERYASMTEEKSERPPTIVAPSVQAAMRIEMVHRNERDEDRDSLEFGPADLRMKIYGSIGRPGEFKAKVDEAKKLMLLVAEDLERSGLRSVKKKNGGE